MNAIAKKLHPKFIKGATGRSDFVILPSQEFEELLDDMEDLACIAERRDEPTVPLAKLKEKLKHDGLL